MLNTNFIMVILGFTLFGSIFAFYLSLIVLFLILIISEIEGQGISATFAFIVFVISNYLWGNLPLVDIFSFQNIAMYLGIGFVFAIIRTYFKGRELDKKDRENYELKEAIFRWWFLFPISIINWVFGKLLKDLYNFIYSKVEKFFIFIFNAQKDNVLNK